MKADRTTKQALAHFASGLTELPDAEIDRLALYYSEQSALAKDLCGFTLSDLIALTERERGRRAIPRFAAPVEPPP